MNARERKFVETVVDYYEKEGRHSLPWRQTHDPYHILVSELMLQQTQVSRVMPKYVAFLELFPTVKALATAPLGDVLRAWQGLGYNRRARFLHEAAKALTREYAGVFPRERATLLALPGIGPYTAGAIRVFAYNEPDVLIETNVRTVYIHHFYKNAEGVTDGELRPLIEKTIQQPPAHWYAALMDYGTYLKQTVGNKNKQSSSYKTQSTFAGSDRQIRGQLLKLLTTQSYTEKGLQKALIQFEGRRVAEQLAALALEGLVTKQRTRYTLPS